MDCDCHQWGVPCLGLPRDAPESSASASPPLADEVYHLFVKNIFNGLVARGRRVRRALVYCAYSCSINRVDHQYYGTVANSATRHCMYADQGIFGTTEAALLISVHRLLLKGVGNLFFRVI